MMTTICYNFEILHKTFNERIIPSITQSGSCRLTFLTGSGGQGKEISAK